MEILAQGVTLDRGRGPVLSGVDLRAESGKSTVLLGPNGVGKSTLLDCLSGRLKPVAGSATVGGRDLFSLGVDEKAKLLSFVPQKERPVFDYTIRDLCGMGRLAWSAGWTETDDDARVVSESLEAVGITSLADKSILEVSGGELQLALVARALCQTTPVTLMDEPTASLDLSRHSLLAGVIRGLKNAGRTSILATHDINWALSIGDWFVCLKDGRVIWQGHPSEARDAIEEAFSVSVTWLETEDGPRVLSR